MGWEKAGDCQDAGTTYEINQCLSRERATTKANYEAFLGAARSAGTGPDRRAGTGCPTGKPLTRTELLAGFDATVAQ
jgi:hypothetical protein